VRISKRNQNMLVALAGATPLGAQLARTLVPEMKREGEKELFLQADAAIRSAANVLTFGAWDRLNAAALAAVNQRSGTRFADRYAREGAGLAELNRTNARQRPVATAAGQAAGTVAGVALTGGGRQIVSAVPRLAGATRLTVGDVAGLLTGGAVVGVGAQTAEDLATGQRSPTSDYVAAGTGGVASVAALPLGPARAGAVGGWVDSASRDMLAGRPLSLERAGQAAMMGALGGRYAGQGGYDWSNGLAPVAKGRLGETLGSFRSFFNGHPREILGKSLTLVPGTKSTRWIPDGVSGDVFFEDKFGYKPRLSYGQRAAQRALGDNFFLSNFLPEDVALLTGIPAGLLAATLQQEAIDRQAPSDTNLVLPLPEFSR